MWVTNFAFFVMLWWSANAQKVNDTLNFKIKDCLNSQTVVTCLADQAASSFEKSLNSNIYLVEGVQLLRNDRKIINHRKGKSLDGIQRLLSAVSDFLDTHTFSIDLTKGRSLENGEEEEETEVETERRKGGGGGGGGQGGGFFNMNKKALKQEKRYYQYAFMVLLGIFGLTGPLVMSILATTAAHSLLAAKAALIMVGSVALKKMMESGHGKPKVKVTTVPLHEEADEYDRISNSFNHIPYGYGGYGNNPYNNPYNAHYPVDNSISDNTEFAPVLYEAHKTVARKL